MWLFIYVAGAKPSALRRQTATQIHSLFPLSSAASLTSVLFFFPVALYHLSLALSQNVRI